MLTQQEASNQSDEDIADLKVRLTELTKFATPTTGTAARILNRKLAYSVTSLIEIEFA